MAITAKASTDKGSAQSSASRGLRLAQAIRHRQHIVALLLHALRIQIFAPVERGVIGRDIADKGEIDSRQSRRQHWREVGVVGHVFVDRAGNRRGGVMRHAMGIEIDQPGIAGAGLEQKARALVAAHIHIHHRGDSVFHLADIGGRTQQTGLFAIAEQSNDGTPCRATRLQGADTLQQNRDAGTVIAAARARRDAVAMGHQQHSLAGAGQHIGDDVGDRGATDLVPARLADTTHLGFFARRHAHRGQFLENAFAHGGRLGAADRMGSLRLQHPAQGRIGSRLRKYRRGRVRPQRPGHRLAIGR